MRNISLRKKIYALLVGSYAAIGSIASAQVTAPPPPGGTNDINLTPFGPASGDFEVILASILDKLVQFGTLLLAVMIVWTGFLFVSSGGAPDKLATAKKSLIACIIGGAIILGALGISELIVDTVGTI